MFKRTIALALAATTFVGSAVAADLVFPEPAPEPTFPEYPQLPEVDYGLVGSYYLRGSLGGHSLWPRAVQFNCCDAEVSAPGNGYSVGTGVGYEYGDGWRSDITLDYLVSHGIKSNGYTASLRSTLALANIYYDVDLDGMGPSVEGGWSVYAGAGIGKAWSWTSATHTSNPALVEGEGARSWAGAGMVGMSYDMGNVVADVGYRALLIKGFSTSGGTDLWAKDSIAHEIRASLRYRFH